MYTVKPKMRWKNQNSKANDALNVNRISSKYRKQKKHHILVHFEIKNESVRTFLIGQLILGVIINVHVTHQSFCYDCPR